MSRESNLRRVALVSLLTLTFAVASFAARGVAPSPGVLPDPQTPDCSKMSDDDIVKAVIQNIKKRFNEKEIKRDLHLNITCKDGVVEITGDAHGINPKNPREVRTRVTSIANKTLCVKKVVTKHFTHVHTGVCGQGEKPCNGGCIPQDAQCNRMG